MKKLTLSIGLIISMLSSQAQDTTCTYFKNKKVLEFNYYTNKVLYEAVHDNKYYEIDVKYGDVLCLHFSDQKKRFRKVITTYFDGFTQTDILDSKNDVYYSPKGVIKVSVSKPRILFLGKR